MQELCVEHAQHNDASLQSHFGESQLILVTSKFSRTILKALKYSTVVLFITRKNGSSYTRGSDLRKCWNQLPLGGYYQGV